jgi:uridine kinase
MKLERMFYLGGSPCAGKSTIAKHLAEKFELRLYHADDHFERHCQLATHTQPSLQTIRQLSGDEIWLIPVTKQVERALNLYHEEFDFIQKDLQTLKKPLIVEGAALLPEHVAPLIDSSTKAFYLVPSETSQRHHYGKREWARGVVEKTSDPEQAFENWMQRDARFALEVKRQAFSLGLPAITVDGSENLEIVEVRVIKHFGLTL